MERAWRSIAASLAGLATGLGAAQAAGDLYQWTDAEGVVRYTAHLERIPRSALPEVLVMRRAGPEATVLSFRWGETPVAADATSAEGAVVAARVEPPGGAPEASEEAPPAREVPSFDEWSGALDRLHPLEGGRVYRTRVVLEGRDWERLRVGLFPTLSAARAALRRLAPHFPDAWIDRASDADRAALAAAGGPGAAAETGWVVQLAARPLDPAQRAEALAVPVSGRPRAQVARIVHGSRPLSRR